MILDWEEQICVDLSGTPWLECKIKEGLYLEVHFVGPGLSYQSRIVYGQEWSDIIDGPIVGTVDAAKTDAMALLDAFLMSRIERYSGLAGIEGYP